MYYEFSQLQYIPVLWIELFQQQLGFRLLLPDEEFCLQLLMGNGTWAFLDSGLAHLAILYLQPHMGPIVYFDKVQVESKVNQ